MTKEELRKEFEEKFTAHIAFAKKKLELIDEANKLRRRISEIDDERATLNRQEWEASSRLKELYEDAGILHVSVTGTKTPGLYKLMFFRYVDGEAKVHLTREVTEKEMPALNGVLYSDNELIYEIVEAGLLLLSEDKYVIILDRPRGHSFCYNISSSLLAAKRKK